MFVFTAKMSKKLIVSVILCILALLCVLFITIFTRGTTETYNGDALLTAAYEKKSVSADTNDDRRAFLAQYGWTASEDAREFYDVTIPKEFDRVYEKYNDLQKSQGFDLKKYRGKTVTKYSYVITDYPEYDREVYATLLVYKNKVIGGDISSAALDGFMHGFEKTPAASAVASSGD